MDINNMDNLIAALDYMLNTPRKRHIVGGLLLSVSLMFGGMALTIMTISTEEEETYE